MRNKVFILGLMGLMGIMSGAQAQNGFNMPYSQFGIGSSDLPLNMPMSVRMGGTYVTQAGNNFVNPFNPASYASVEKESFVFDMGIGIQSGSLMDNKNNSMYDADGNLGYLTVAMPVTSWWKVAGGLLPLTLMDYSSVSEQEGEGFGTVKTIYDGTGGTSQLFLGTAFNIPAGKSRSLQVGANVNYLTGRVQRAISFDFQGNDSTYYMNSRRYRETRLSNVTFDLGLQLRQELGKNYTLGLGVVYKPYRDMSVRDLAMIYTYHSSDPDQYPVDTIFPGLGEDPEFRSTLEQAQTLSVGISFERNKKWQIAADATFGAWNGLKYTEDSNYAIFGQSALSSGPYSRYAAGFERIGDMDAATYWGRISWSFGAHMERGNLYLELDGATQRVDEWGVGLGATMPMRKGRSLLTISLGYSSLGSRDVLQRNVMTLGIAVSSCERWFVKRKFN